MAKKIVPLIITILFLSCSQKIDKKQVIKNITNDNLTIKKVKLIQESNFYNFITDVENSAETSKEAWKNAPELNKTYRIALIDKACDKYLKLKNSIYLNEDKVFLYQFEKRNKTKKYLGFAVILFHNEVQKTLYYEIKPAPYDYFPSGGIKQIINKGLVEEINKLEVEYLAKQKKY